IARRSVVHGFRATLWRRSHAFVAQPQQMTEATTFPPFGQVVEKVRDVRKQRVPSALAPMLRKNGMFEVPDNSPHQRLDRSRRPGFGSAGARPSPAAGPE